jgi:ferric-dicitrate binding protein FerR (iron transport regulator)
MSFRIAVVWAVFGLLFAFDVSPANAQKRVGEAAVVQNEVVRVSGAAASPINVGDDVVRDEIVRTGLNSAARLVMADSTNLSLGPNSTIKLDRTVFKDEQTYREIAIRLTTGAFRFVTGHSDKAAYKITTSVATIGVRGTRLDISVKSAPIVQNIIALLEGASLVCSIRGQCIELTQPGDTAIITLTGGKITLQKTSTPPWTFAGNCAAAAGLCTVTQYADATPMLDDGSEPTGMLCGR